MFDHIGLKVKDLEKSVKFYGAALEALGQVMGSKDASSASFGPKDAQGLYLYSGGAVKQQGTHLAFLAPDRKAVDAFHQAGLGAGGKDNGAPGIRADYSPKYYAAFLIDPDGNNVEAVCFK